MRRLVLGGCLLALAVGSTVTRPSQAADRVRLVAPGVELRSFTRLDPVLGLQEIRVLRFRLDDPRVRLRPVLAQDHGNRRMRVSELVLASGALAAVNGNFFTADGNVRGIFLADGILRSEPESAIGGARTPRAAWRLEGGTIAIGRPGSALSFSVIDQPFTLNGIDRAHGYLGNPDESVLQTSAYGLASSTPVGGFEAVLAALPPMTPSAEMATTVTEVRDGPGPILPGSGVISASGTNATQLRAMVGTGTPVTVRVNVDDPAFTQAQFAGGGGPWVVHDGALVDREGLLGEGFSPVHLNARAPRTAMGRTGDGSILLVTVDGRQPGRSIGTSLDVLGTIMIELGAVEALSLDGGGSTAMAVDGVVVNRPSGQDTTGRPGSEQSVADAVAVYFDFVPRASSRRAGVDRLGTAIEVSKDRAAALSAVIATAADFPDALVGAPLAAKVNGPILLTGPNGLDGRVVAELQRLGAREAFVLGGAVALTAQIDADLANLGISSRRLAGVDRYETAAKVAAEVGASPTVMVASGEGFPDALAAGAVGLPVLLTTRQVLPEVTAAAIGSATPMVVGGTAAISPSVLPAAARLAGIDRHGTSTVVADWGIANGRYSDARVTVARGDDYPDALVGGALRQPLLLVGRFGLDVSAASWEWLRTHGPTIADAILLGGRVALSTMTHIQVDEAIG
jgi:putative cell wall-binding protein